MNSEEQSHKVFSLLAWDLVNPKLLKDYVDFVLSETNYLPRQVYNKE